MELFVVRNVEEFDRIQPQWDALIGTLSPAPLPLTHSWLRSWWNAFSDNLKMEFRCLYKNNVLVGVAPLVRSRERFRGIPVTMLKLAANGHSPYSSVVIDTSLTPSEAEEALLALTHVASNEIALFFKIGANDNLERFLMDRSKNGHARVGEKPSIRTPVVEIDQSWDDFYRSRPRSLKKSLNNKLNRLKKAGDFSIGCEKLVHVDQPLIDDLVAVSAHSWKSAVKSDLRSNPKSRRFLLNLVEAFGTSGALNAWVARSGGKPVAFELHLVHDEVVYPIRADYDQAFKALSPGSVLEYSALRSLFEQGGYTQYYTCADDYWYLSNWTTNYRELCSVEVFGNSAKVRALYWLEYSLIPLIKRVIRTGKKKHGFEKTVTGR